jgi:succinyl-CoA synthetase beta subunit
MCLQMATTPAQARQIALSIRQTNPNAEFVVKAQIHAGGRGKGHFTNGFKGGVHVTKSIDKVESDTKAMLGEYLPSFPCAAVPRRI